MRLLSILAAIVPACFGADRGVRLKAALLRLGGAFPKLGQQASLRFDLFPADVCNALSSLQSEKGQGTIGYVERVGTLAIKRIHPGRREQAERDLRLLMRIFWWLRFVPVLRRLQLHAFAVESKQIFAEAFDLRYEGAYTKKLRPLVLRFGVRIPRVISYSRDELVTEWVDGQTGTDILTDPRGFGMDRGRRHAQTSLFALLACIFELNLFPFDLHPGNIIIDRRNRLWWIDISPASTDSAFLRHFYRFVEGLADRDWKWAAYLFCYLQRGIVGTSVVSRFFGQGRLSRTTMRLVEVIGQWAQGTAVPSLPYWDRSLNTLTQRMVAVTTLAGGSLNWAWLRIQQALTTVERWIEVFWADINYLRTAERYIADVKRRNPKGLYERVNDIIDMTHQQLDFMTNDGLFASLFQGR